MALLCAKGRAHTHEYQNTPSGFEATKDGQDAIKGGGRWDFDLLYDVLWNWQIRNGLKSLWNWPGRSMVTN